MGADFFTRGVLREEIEILHLNQCVLHDCGGVMKEGEFVEIEYIGKNKGKW